MHKRVLQDVAMSYVSARDLFKLIIKSEASFCCILQQFLLHAQHAHLRLTLHGRLVFSRAGPV